MLEETIQLMENRKNSKKDQQKSVSVQTDDEGIMRCNECEYPAEDIYDLGEHMHEYHALNESCEQTIVCHYCSKNFQTKGALMIHRKKSHKEKVRVCRYFSEGNCLLGDETCWYNHSETEIALTEFKCSICDKVFKIRSDFMHHRKQQHTKNVPLCLDSVNGACRFGRENCWFHHNEMEKNTRNENIEHSIYQNQGLIQKLFEMMEKFTQHIVQENK